MTIKKKPRLTPEFAYIIGFWKKLRYSEGIGIKSTKEKVEHFINLIIKNQLTTPDKLIIKENDTVAYFYHTKLRTFFEKVINEQLDRFKYDNEYSANYFAGFFDAIGEYKFLKSKSNDEKLLIVISRSDSQEEIMFARHNFKVKLRKGILYILNGEEFTRKYNNYFKLQKIPLQEM
ncbi:MAG: hypothetical protein QXF76_03060 [Candidatus Anstonellales archaeon]